MPLNYIEAKSTHDIDSFLNQNNRVAIISFYSNSYPSCKSIGHFAYDLMQSNEVGLIKVDIENAADLSSEY